MNRGLSKFSSMRVGRGWSDKARVIFYSLFRSRPGVWRLWSNIFGRKDWCIHVETPSGCTRLMFEPNEVMELTVVDELLFDGLYQLEQPFDVVVDCGAFRGISTIFLQDQAKAGTVVAFEPNPENVRVLQRRLQSALPTAKLFAGAVGHEDGVARFGGHGVGGKVGEGGVEVPVYRLAELDVLREAKSLLLKMDVEGAEREILPDLRPFLPRHCTILLETHSTESAARELLCPYEQDGFAVKKLRGRKDEESDVFFIDWEIKRT